MPTRRLTVVLGAVVSALAVVAGVLVAPAAAVAAGAAEVWAFLGTPATRVYQGANAGLQFGVAGQYFAPGERVTVSYRGVVRTFKAETTGRFTKGSFASEPTAFGIEPDAAPDEAELTAVGSAGSTALNRMPVQAPTLTADPATGGPGGAARMVGTGFASGATVTFGSSDGPVPAPVVAAVRGWVVVDVVLPTTVGGSRTLTAGDGYRAATATATLQAPRLVVDLYHTSPGDDVAVTLEHFRPGSTPSLSADNPESGFTPPGTATVDAYGRAVVTPRLPGDACPGATVVTARDAETGLTASGSFRVRSTYPNALPAREGTGCSIPAGDALTSPSGRFRLAVQTDGNLVLYDGARPTWATRTFAPNARLAMQLDGNLVLYAGGRPMWSTGTRWGTRVVLRDDTGLTLDDTAGQPVWSAPLTDRLTAGTSLAVQHQLGSANAAYRLASQRDGNVVLYGPGNSVEWVAHGYSADTRVVMQTDGNFVIYEYSGRVVFTSRTSGTDNVLVLQDDGNLVVYSPTGRALWSRR